MAALPAGPQARAPAENAHPAIALLFGRRRIGLRLALWHDLQFLR